MIEIKYDLAKLRAPFPPEQIGKLPKGGVFLDFVGHGYLTQRMLDVDPEWNWEPVAFDAAGLPLLDEHGGLWIRLTICGVTRLGYGDAGGKRGPDATKIAIGDALRNAGMRFGLALDLWCKGDPADAHHAPQERLPVVDPASAARANLAGVCRDGGLDLDAIAKRFSDEYATALGAAEALTINAFAGIIAAEVAARG